VLHPRRVEHWCGQRPTLTLRLRGVSSQGCLKYLDAWFGMQPLSIGRSSLGQLVVRCGLRCADHLDLMRYVTKMRPSSRLGHPMDQAWPAAAALGGNSSRCSSCDTAPALARQTDCALPASSQRTLAAPAA
jgi:hypothetical protein